MIYQVGGAGAASWGVFGKVMQLLGLLGGFGGFLLLMVASGDSAFLLEGLVLIFSLLLLAGVAVEVVAISRLAEVYRLDGVRGKAISAAAVLWLGVVVAGVMPLIEPQLIFFSRTVEYFAVLIWAVLMWRVYKRFASFTGAFADAATWHLAGGIFQLLLLVGFIFAMSGYRQLTRGPAPAPPKTSKTLAIVIIAVAISLLAFIGYILGTMFAPPSGVGSSGGDFASVLSVSEAFVFFNGTVTRGRPEVYGDAYVYVVAYAPGIPLPRAVVQRIAFDAAEKPVYLLPIPQHGVVDPLDFVDVLPDNAKNPVILLTYSPDKLTTVAAWLQSINNLPQSDYIIIELKNGKPVSVTAVA